MEAGSPKSEDTRNGLELINMSWMTRVATASLLVVALVAVPLVLDLCAASCEADHHAIASTPSCHHAGAAMPRIGQVPAPCGHDDNGTIVATNTTAAPLLRAFTCAVAVVTVPVQPANAADSQFVRTDAPPGSSLTLDARSLPLRV